MDGKFLQFSETGDDYEVIVTDDFGTRFLRRRKASMIFGKGDVKIHRRLFFL